ncbi:conserved hypothetical protein [Listeria monocytogenes FSL F2-208]|nr:conserved hypothetical protein [Listeria monocytogenes FSL F2-208]
MISHEVSGSRLPVGSSAINTLGIFAMERAMDIRCCSPPESSSGNILTLCLRLTKSSTSITRSLITDGSVSTTSIA